jgi:hypothetical protein
MGLLFNKTESKDHVVYRTSRVRRLLVVIPVVALSAIALHWKARAGILVFAVLILISFGSWAEEYLLLRKQSRQSSKHPGEIWVAKP